MYHNALWLRWTRLVLKQSEQKHWREVLDNSVWEVEEEKDSISFKRVQPKQNVENLGTFENLLPSLVLVFLIRSLSKCLMANNTAGWEIWLQLFLLRQTRKTVWLKSFKCYSTFSPRVCVAWWIKLWKDPYSSHPGIWDHPSHIWLFVDVSQRMESPLNQNKKSMIRVDVASQHWWIQKPTNLRYKNLE